MSSRVISNALERLSHAAGSGYLIFSREDCGRAFNHYLSPISTKSTLLHQREPSSIFHEVQQARNPCVLSFPGVMGSAKDIFFGRSAAALPNRVVKFVEVFSSFCPTLHLAISSPLKQIIAVPELQLMNEHRLSKVRSWASVVNDLVAALPNNELIVWDMDNPKISAFAMIVTILGETDTTQIGKIGNLIRTVIGSEKRKTTNVTKFTQAFFDYLDWLYEDDLERISCMKGVTLMSQAAVPPEFHLR